MPFRIFHIKKNLRSPPRLYYGSLFTVACPRLEHGKRILSKNKLRRYPQQLDSFCAFAIKSAYAIKIKRLCHKH